ncbi:MAG: hypothetical protein QF752_09090 [Planctomycetota bacterium]|jgi:hypothetical protein|nr:hypothetical protein [Planctomycetota bacterium]
MRDIVEPGEPEAISGDSKSRSALYRFVEEVFEIVGGFPEAFILGPIVILGYVVGGLSGLYVAIALSIVLLVVSYGVAG